MKDDTEKQMSLDIGLSESGKKDLKSVYDERMDHWVGMPEYIQNKIMPYKELVIRFKNKSDFLSFFEKIDQKPPGKLKSFWYPESKSKPVGEIYLDES